MIDKTRKTNRGASIIETLFYIVIFVVISIAVINAMIMMMRSFKETKVEREIVQSGEIMERVVREIRGAYLIDPQSTATDLKIYTKSGSGVSKLEDFNFTASNLQFSEDGVLTGNLNGPNISVQDASFTQITTAVGKAVKIMITVKAKDDARARTYVFDNTVVLRGTY